MKARISFEIDCGEGQERYAKDVLHSMISSFREYSKLYYSKKIFYKNESKLDGRNKKSCIELYKEYQEKERQYDESIRSAKIEFKKGK